MGQLDKMIKKAEEAQERRSQQQSGEATVSPPPVENQEHEDVPATVVITQTQPTQGEPEPEAIPNSPSWWKRVRDRFSSGGRVRRSDVSAEAAEKVTEPTTTDAGVSQMPTDRIQAVNDMAGILQEVASYETAVNTNARIIKDVRKIYDDDADYIREVKDMTIYTDHQRLVTTNQMAQANIDLLARNLYMLPSVTRLAEKYIIKAQEAVRAEIAVQVDEVTAKAEKAPQEAREEAKQTPTPTPKQKEKPQTVSPSSDKGIMPILKDVALAVLFFATVALGGAYFTGNNGHADSHTGSIDTLATIDSLKAVIARQNKELSASKDTDTNYYLLRLRYNRMAELKAREEADAIFQNYADYKDLLWQNKKLLKEKVRLELEVEDWAKAYDQLKAVAGANTAKNKIKEGREEPEEPRRGKSAFNSIEAEKDHSPYSPQSY